MGFLALALSTANAWCVEMRHVTFRESTAIFSNPGQGWMTTHRDPKEGSRFPCSVVYIRFDWAQVEPAEGQYNWQFIDDVMAAWKPRGASVSMRVMTTNPHSESYYCSPKWLFDLGCKSFEYENKGDDPTTGGRAMKRIEPDYANPIFLAKHGKFITELGKRYNGSPDVEFLDIGSYGLWGEWHTPHAAPVETRRQIVDMYLKAFPQTPLVFMSDDVEVLKYAIERGAGMRRDGVGSPWHEQNWIGSKRYASVESMADVWTKAPIVFEWYGSYNYLKSQNWPFDAAVDFMLNNHVTLINDDLGTVPPSAQPQLEKLARLAGYRFVLSEMTHEKSIRPGESANIKMKWENVGVGKLHRPYELTLVLRSQDGETVARADAISDARDWLPGSRNITAKIQIPTNTKAGNYNLLAAIVDVSNMKPPLHLAIEAPQTEGWYVVSQLEVQ